MPIVFLMLKGQVYAVPGSYLLQITRDVLRLSLAALCADPAALPRLKQINGNKSDRLTNFTQAAYPCTVSDIKLTPVHCLRHGRWH